MWFFIIFLAVIAALALYLGRRGSTGVGQNFSAYDAANVGWFRGERARLDRRR